MVMKYTFVSASCLRGIAGYDVVRIAVGFLLLVAAGLKGHQLATEPVAGTGIRRSRTPCVSQRHTPRTTQTRWYDTLNTPVFGTAAGIGRIGTRDLYDWLLKRRRSNNARDARNDDVGAELRKSPGAAGLSAAIRTRSYVESRICAGQASFGRLQPRELDASAAASRSGPEGGERRYA